MKVCLFWRPCKRWWKSEMQYLLCRWTSIQLFDLQYSQILKRNEKMQVHTWWQVIRELICKQKSQVEIYSSSFWILYARVLVHHLSETYYVTLGLTRDLHVQMPHTCILFFLPCLQQCSKHQKVAIFPPKANIAGETTLYSLTTHFTFLVQQSPL